MGFLYESSLISTWFSLAGSRHSLTLPLGLGTCTKLLHHSIISSTPNGVIISCCWNLSNSSINSFWSAYALCHGGTCYGLLPGLTCNENVPSKHSLSINTSIKFPFLLFYYFSACFFCHSLCLALEENV